MSEQPKHIPPELDDIDASWDEDEIDTAPSSSAVASQNPSCRDTVMPDVPIEEYVKTAMSQAEHDLEEKSGVQERGVSSRPTGESHPFGCSAAAPAGGEPGRLAIDDLSLDLDPGRVTLPDDQGVPADPLGTPIAPPAVDPTVADLRDRYAAGDFTGALLLAESVLETEPDHADAKRYAQSCRDVLVQMYTARLGPLDQVVRVGVPPDQVRWLSLDHRSGFLLSLVDGTSTMEELLDISGMPRLDALRILFTLVEQQVIVLERV